MAAFDYTALNQNGERERGVAEGDTERQVRQQLRERGLVPIEVSQVKQAETKEKRSWFQRKKMSYADLALVTRQIATLLAASIPLDEVLSGVAQQTENGAVKSIILGVRAKVLEGHSLAAGLGDFPDAFPLLYRTTVSAGERSGKLDQVLLKLADYTEKQHRLKQKVQQALIYPIMMIGVSILIVTFLLLYVVPKIVTVFVQTGQKLPGITIALLGVSHFLERYGWAVVIALVAIVWIFKHIMKNPLMRKSYYQFLLKLPVLGKAIRTANTARFARTFGILHAATVPVLDAMTAAGLLIVPPSMQETVKKAVDRVREGSTISRALGQTKTFPPILLHLISSGESSGQLDRMLEKAADNQETELEGVIQGALTLFEPALILFMGGIVLFIVLSVMLPIFSLDTFGG